MKNLLLLTMILRLWWCTEIMGYGPEAGKCLGQATGVVVGESRDYGFIVKVDGEKKLRFILMEQVIDSKFEEIKP